MKLAFLLLLIAVLTIMSTRVSAVSMFYSRFPRSYGPPVDEEQEDDEYDNGY